MTAMNRNYLILVLSLVALVTVAMAFAGFEAPFGAGMYFAAAIIEVVVYFVVTMISNARATIGMAFITSIVYTLLRWICSFLGGVLHGLNVTGGGVEAIQVCINPISGVIQVALLLMAGPYLLSITIPELVGAGEAALLRGEAQRSVNATTKQAGLEATPSGGFFQVFSFEELAAMMKKSPGLEGFIIYSNEGMVVWKDFPVQVNLDVLTARVSSEASLLGQLFEENGLTKVRRLMLESREHYLFATTLNQNFGLIMLFSGRSAPEEIFSRIAVLAKSTREFLQWKYPSLGITANVARDRAALEMV
jgi:predicted regulator of Ras-like GTPase activity (Roadblock/LC7/MglB family)